MKIFRRLAVSVHSKVDAVADKLENREAVSLAYIREYQRNAAKAKVRLRQLEEQVSRFEQQSRTLTQEIELWAQRARQAHQTDEQKALQCVARVKALQKQHHQLQHTLSQSRGLRDRMADDVTKIMTRLEEHQRKHQLLSSRQICVQALNMSQHHEDGLEYEIEDVLTRWETDIVTDELDIPPGPAPDDPLAQEFESVELEQDLRATLAEILESSDKGEEK